jgi:hypothetical protein
MNCRPTPAGACARCGRRLPDVTKRRACRPGLGDLVAAGLEAVGLTTTRADALARRLGLPGCGCPGRREWLNRAAGKPGNPGNLATLTAEPKSGT